MPIFNLTADRAAGLWKQHASTYTDQITAMVGLVPTAVIVDWLVGQIVEIAWREAPRAWAWFARRGASLKVRAEAAADRLDDRLRWNWMANEDLRDLFEANDDLWDVFQGGLRSLMQIVEADVVEAEIASSLSPLEGGAFAGFFQRAPITLERPDLSRQLPATRPDSVPVQNMAQAAQVRDLIRRIHEQDERIATQERELAALRASAPDQPTVIDIQPIDAEPELTDADHGLVLEIDDEASTDADVMTSALDAPSPGLTAAARAKAAIKQDGRENRRGVPVKTADTAAPRSRRRSRQTQGS